MQLFSLLRQDFWYNAGKFYIICERTRQTDGLTHSIYAHDTFLGEIYFMLAQRPINKAAFEISARDLSTRKTWHKDCLMVSLFPISRMIFFFFFRFIATKGAVDTGFDSGELENCHFYRKWRCWKSVLCEGIMRKFFKSAERVLRHSLPGWLS